MMEKQVLNETSTKQICCSPASSRTAEEVIATALHNVDIMEKVFTYFCLEEQNIFRLVCRDWNIMAHIFWASSKYDCLKEFSKHGSILTVLEDLKKRPLLKHVVCNLKSRLENFSVILAIVDHIDDVHHLALHVVTPCLVKQIVNKFKNLESVLLDVNSPDISESLYLLKQCPNLTKLELCDRFKNLENECDSSLCTLCDILSNDDYPNLQYLITMPVRSIQIAERLAYLLKSRHESITFLELEFFEYSNDVFSAINLCTNLEKLKLTLHWPKNYFQLFQLSKVKDLTLRFFGHCTEDVLKNTIVSTLESGSFKGLQYFHLQLSHQEHKLGILQYIGSYLTNLKSLYLWDVDIDTMDEDLKYISRLNALTYLLISGSRLTASGTSSIKELKNLRSLKLINCCLTDGALLPLKNCHTIQNLHISGATLTANVMMHVTSCMRNLRCLVLTDCGISDPDRERVIQICRLKECVCCFTD